MHQLYADEPKGGLFHFLSLGGAGPSGFNWISAVSQSWVI